MNIHAGIWRWPLVVGLPLIFGGLLIGSGVTRLRFEGRTVLAYAGSSGDLPREIKIFESPEVQKRLALILGDPSVSIALDLIPGERGQAVLRTQASWPNEVVRRLTVASQVYIDQSFAKLKAQVRQDFENVKAQRAATETRLNGILQERKQVLAASKPVKPREDISAKIRELKTRRQFLIDRYPTHTAIPALAKQIQELQSRLTPRRPVPSARVSEISRKLNETKVRYDHLSRRLQQILEMEKTLKTEWSVRQPAEKPTRPVRMDRWPLFTGVFVCMMVFGLVVLKGKAEEPANAFDELWKTSAPEAPVELKVVPAESAAVAPAEDEKAVTDPVTEKAAGLYARWVEVVRILYAPSPEPPQGVLDQVSPLLKESLEFLPEGHDVLARYLARTVSPGDLAAHVARTVLMTLTGAQEAGVTAEHRYAMALAALFHDLAVVPRPPALQEEVGSEVGRLSASVLRRIPGLDPSVLAVVEDILIGMDEFKLETWQNVANGKNFEPLSKVLREIDRFEKVMQKQKSRQSRQVAHRKAV